MTRTWMFACSLSLAGCTAIGPASVVRDRFDYLSSISESSKQQMLLNLLKVRYTDAPVFLDVTSVINAYTLDRQLGASGQYAPAGRGDTFLGLSATGRFSEQPTISYAPLSGDRFARAMLSPIPLASLLLILQGGYPIDGVLRMYVNTVNGLDNARGGDYAREGDERYFELLGLLRQVQAAGRLGFPVATGGDRRTLSMRLRPTTDASMLATYRRIGELLGVDTARREIPISFGSDPAVDGEIVIQTRSIIEVLADIADQIDVPRSDVDEGRVRPSARPRGPIGSVPPPVRVSSSTDPPADAFVAARYRDRWFWIDDRDHPSKAAFNLVSLVISLTETGSSQTVPIVSVPLR